jgi:hypothetical protein
MSSLAVAAVLEQQHNGFPRGFELDPGKDRAGVSRCPMCRRSRKHRYDDQATLAGRRFVQETF